MVIGQKKYFGHFGSAPPTVMHPIDPSAAAVGEATKGAHRCVVSSEVNLGEEIRSAVFSLSTAMESMSSDSSAMWLGFLSYTAAATELDSEPEAEDSLEEGVVPDI